MLVASGDRAPLEHSLETQQGKEPQLIGGELISWLFYEEQIQEQIQGAVRMRIEPRVS